MIHHVSLPSVLSCAQNRSFTTNVSPSMRDEICQFKHYPFVVFNFRSISRYILHYIHLQDLFSSLLVNLIRDVYTIIKMAYIFDERPRATAVLLCLATNQFLFRSHDFAALMFKITQRLLYSVPSMLQTLLC